MVTVFYRSTNPHYQSIYVSDVSWTHIDEIPASTHKMAALLRPPSTWFFILFTIFVPSISTCLGAMVYPPF